MTYLTAEQRGDLAEEMLPVAANLAVIVHGDGGPEDVQAVLAGLDDARRTALIVALAALVDPEQPLSRALGWLNPTGPGVVAPHWGEERTVRDLAPDSDGDPDEVDMVAVHGYLDGHQVELTEPEFLAVLEEALARGMSRLDIDRVRGVGRGVTERRVDRLRKRYQRAGRDLPVALRPEGKREDFTAAQVVEIREVYAAGGVTDLELAMRYGRSRNTITCLLSGITYPDAGGPVRPRRGAKPKETSRVEFAGQTGPAPVLDVARAS
ncbi:hypothetical protein DBP19_36045 [Streptomyces sp. CS090A]|uniref:hypothetical protein n=1 Tax=Streptomyces sp. CS090A TaxID=2162710 RepID=UPI000D5107F8|nr:hypothetical protein [Streptomyces sp. CS090A]PVC80551.1 hypothetical protein DBP19_36045 [Streptomyces sp. CS090A]